MDIMSSSSSFEGVTRRRSLWEHSSLVFYNEQRDSNPSIMLRLESFIQSVWSGGAQCMNGYIPYTNGILLEHAQERVINRSPG